MRPQSAESNSSAAPVEICEVGLPRLPFADMAHMKRHYLPCILQISIFFVLIVLSLGGELGATTTKAKKKRSHVVRASVTTTAAVRPALARPTGAPALGVVRGGPWTQPTYADSTNGDNIDGEDLEVRREAVFAWFP